MPTSRPTSSSAASLLLAVLILLMGIALKALTLQTIGQEAGLSGHFISMGTWEKTVSLLGGKLIPNSPTGPRADLPYGTIFLGELAITLAYWVLGGVYRARTLRVSWTTAAVTWGFYAGAWGMLAGSWELARLFCAEIGWTWGLTLVLATPEFWQSFCLAGLIASGVVLPLANQEGSLPSSPKIPRILWIAVGLYFVIWGTMNVQLYRGLLIPHGDSSMYEEHIWNFLHGKGFRSYLDDGRLFLGEHIQFIHLFLIPIYILWPSHMLLELCESLFLALGAVAVYRIAVRHQVPTQAAVCLAISYLFYFPLQRLDIAIDFKTFRPEAFGIPLLLFALDALEERNMGRFLPLMLLVMTVKEDYALVVVPLGIWIFWQHRKHALIERQFETMNWQKPIDALRNRHWRNLGIDLVIFGVLYFAIAVNALIPWFRRGQTVHFAGYFSKFGKTPPEIIWNVLFNPALLFSELFAPEKIIYALSLLLPLGFLPLLSPGRLLVALPLFGALALNQLAANPQHHFHAPLVALLYWAAAAGLGSLPAEMKRWKSSDAANLSQRWGGMFGLGCAFVTGLFLSIGPTGIPFWDSGAQAYWQLKYVPGKRAEMFGKVLAKIPKESRVASTDFVHPRFTHYLRSYDFSGYRPNPPDDTDYLVIDRHGPYSQIADRDVQSIEDLKDLLPHAERWELLPDETEGYFIVLKRRKSG
ncbi:MAG: DUF2079 domain-containing protein [Planctomycetales bacterium]